MPALSIGGVIAVVVLVLAVVLGIDHHIPTDVAVLIGLLAVARLT